MPDWLAEALPAGARVGIDPFCHTVDSVRTLVNKLEVSLVDQPRYMVCLEVDQTKICNVCAPVRKLEVDQRKDRGDPVVDAELTQANHAALPCAGCVCLKISQSLTLLLAFCLAGC